MIKQRVFSSPPEGSVKPQELKDGRHNTDYAIYGDSDVCVKCYTI